MGMSEFYGPADEAESIATIHRALDLGFVAYSPLGRGFLTGEIKRFEDFAEDDFRRLSPRFQGENFKRNLELVKRVEAIAKARGCTPAQLALAWVLAQGGDIMPIPGTKRRKYLEQNAAAVDIELTREELKLINEAAPRGAASGMRYPPEMMGLLNV
jgi:aryl-alcohol dehydrogenase-like predicted oxidoreductase